MTNNAVPASSSVNNYTLASALIFRAAGIENSQLQTRSQLIKAVTNFMSRLGSQPLSIFIPTNTAVMNFLGVDSMDAALMALKNVTVREAYDIITQHVITTRYLCRQLLFIQSFEPSYPTALGAGRNIVVYLENFTPFLKVIDMNNNTITDIPSAMVINGTQTLFSEGLMHSVDVVLSPNTTNTTSTTSMTTTMVSPTMPSAAFVLAATWSLTALSLLVSLL